MTISTVLHEREIIDKELKYYGGLQGIIQEWRKEGREPMIVIHDPIANVRVSCYYPPHLYKDVVALFDKKENTVYVSGEIMQDRKNPEKMRILADRFIVDENAKFYQEGDVEKFFGAARGLGKGLSASEYIERGRRREQEPT